MAGESNPTQKQATYKPGDYFITGGKTRVYEMAGYDFDNKTIKYEWREYYTFKPDGAKNMVPPPEGLVGAASGYSLEQQASDKLADKKALEKVQGKTYLGSNIKPKSNYKTTGVLKYPRDTAMADDSDYVLFEFYQYQPPFGKQRGTGYDSKQYNQYSEYKSVADGYSSVVLYMPEDISTGFRAQWGGKNLSNLAEKTLGAAGQNGLGNMAVDTIKSIGEQFQATPSMLAAAAIQKVVTSVSGDQLSNDDVFGALSGAILNPNTELLFAGVDMRNFSLNFKLVPRNQREADDINSIIKVFKKAVLPSRNANVSDIVGNIFGDTEGMKVGFIGVPKLCKVSFMHKTDEHQKLPRFKMCAITSVDVNYTPDGQYATYGERDSYGQPVAINLGLSFQETKICFAEEVEAGDVR